MVTLRTDPPQDPREPHVPIPTPKARFRMGQLRVCPYFFLVIPRPVFIASIKSHFTTDARRLGGKLVSLHSWAGNAFRIETDPAADETRIGLEAGA